MRTNPMIRIILATCVSAVALACQASAWAQPVAPEPAPAREQTPAAGPVEDLQRVLQSQWQGQIPTAQAIEARKKLVEARLPSLRSVGDLYRALTLGGWKDDPRDQQQFQINAARYRQEIALWNLDHDLRRKLADRLVSALQEGGRHKQASRRQAAATLIGEIGGGTPGQGPPVPQELSEALAAEAARLARKDPDAAVRAAAARALGKLPADPAKIAATLQEILGEQHEVPRRAAAAGLLDLARAARKRSHQPQPPTGADARADATATAVAAVRAAGHGLQLEDSQARSLCLQAIQEGGAFLQTMVPDPVDLFPVRGMPVPGPGAEPNELKHAAQVIQQEQERFRPLIVPLRELTPQIAQAVASEDQETGLAACAALEAIAAARLQLLRLTSFFPRPPAEKPTPEGPAMDDPFLAGLRKAVPALGKNLSRHEVRVKLGALYVLETLEGEAAPAVEALVGALEDKNSFVRWGAARALGKMAPREAPTAVKGLAGVLADDNGNVRVTALAALLRYGPAAAPAVPALSKVVSGKEAATRVPAIKVLAAIGRKGAAPAVPQLVAALAASEAPVRAAAVHALGVLGAGGGAAESALRTALGDPDPAVRRAAAEALLATDDAGRSPAEEKQLPPPKPRSSGEP
jgi:HEAT repeat protein